MMAADLTASFIEDRTASTVEPAAQKLRAKTDVRLG
jgi:hypothetical protein